MNLQTMKGETGMTTSDVAGVMSEIGRAARAAAPALAIATAERKHAALVAMAAAIRARSDAILAANALDMEAAGRAGLSEALLDRLNLNGARLAAMVDGIGAIAALPDPVGQVIARWERPNGLKIERVRTPLGVIGVIFESRPNVTADAGALCLKAGNPAILRGGSDSLNSSRAIHACLAQGLAAAKLPAAAIQIVPTVDRAAVGEMLKGLDGNIDVIVPRGGRGLVERVQKEARVPVFAHLEGVCHVFVDASADLAMAERVVVNSKMRRTGVCGAAETLLIDANAADRLAVPLLAALRQAGCVIRASDDLRIRFPDSEPATEEDWRTEYLAPIISAKLVDGVGGAIAHIERWSSHHTEAIVAADARAVARFFTEIDSAILLHNASTQFADGGEFGMGAEIGIATGRMHARGPVGVEQLTSFKYLVRGTGQTRP
jgi:glutamate-5-semialdehyde dehydrogenase